MTFMYTDIVDAKEKARNQGLTGDKVVLTFESMDALIADINLKRETEPPHEETIVETAGLDVELGDSDVLLADGQEIPL